MDNDLSIIVLTHNDELKIVDCLENLNFSEELIVVDDNSKDRTVEICKQYTKNVFVRPLNSNFSNQRNFALNQARGKWVLYVDSDEVVNEKLRKEILESIKKKAFAGFFIKRVDTMWGKILTHGEVGSVKLLRLARRESGKWHGKVHETWRVVGKTSELEFPLIHVPHASVYDFVKDVDDYSTLREIELSEKGKRSSRFAIFVYPIAKFLQNYFLKKGYKDGVPGFIYAMLMSFHSFLVRGKLYLNQK